MSRLKKGLKVLHHVILIIILNYFIAQNYNQKHIKKSEYVRFIPDMKYILLWNPVKGFNEQGQLTFINRKCPKINCYLTRNRTLFDLTYFDVVLFNVQEINAGLLTLPEKRSPHQKYVFVANDSSDNFPICDKRYDSYFNWTWTYKQNSTLPYRHFSVYNIFTNRDDYLRVKLIKPANKDKQLMKEFELKSKAAAIFLNKCVSKSRREVFIEELQTALGKYNLTVDVYGKCGGLKCKKNTMKSCFTALKRYYYFYLALEDSLSADYVTKTVLHAYNNYAVPIVFGKTDYEKFLPPSSYINANGLEIPKLAQQMHQIMSDDARYESYFDWRRFYTIKENDILDPCELCNVLNDLNWLNERTVIEDFIGWWNDIPCEKDVIRKWIF